MQSLTRGATHLAEDEGGWVGLGSQLERGLRHDWTGRTVPRTSTPIKQRLRECFGDVSDKVLLEKMGLSNLTPNQFDGAVAGYGARSTRCLIALALGDMPSVLWPYLSSVTRHRDDAYMAQLNAHPPVDVQR
jgi:hypothetical protein